MEGVVLGTKAAVEALAAAGFRSREIKVAGGATRSDLWLQMHADATGLPILVTDFDNAPLMGSAILAAVGAGLFGDNDFSMTADSKKFEIIKSQVENGIEVSSILRW